MLSKMKNFIDVIIPRGGKNLVKKVQDLSSVPIIGHLEGICHTYIDKDADLNMAIKIVHNAKLRNTSICGATETILPLIRTLSLNLYWPLLVAGAKPNHQMYRHLIQQSLALLEIKSLSTNLLTEL